MIRLIVVMMVMMVVMMRMVAMVRRMRMIITRCLNSVYGAFIDPSRAARLFLLQDIGVLRMP